MLFILCSYLFSEQVQLAQLETGYKFIKCLVFLIFHIVFDQTRVYTNIPTKIVFNLLLSHFFHLPSLREHHIPNQVFTRNNSPKTSKQKMVIRTFRGVQSHLWLNRLIRNIKNTEFSNLILRFEWCSRQNVFTKLFFFSFSRFSLNFDYFVEAKFIYTALRFIWNICRRKLHFIKYRSFPSSVFYW